MKTILLATAGWCLCLSVHAFGFTENHAVTAMARGGSHLACDADVYSIPSDLALTGNDSLTFGFSVYNLYGVKELFGYHADAVCLTSFGACRLNLSHFGYASYRETDISIGYGYAIGRRVSLGLNLHACLLHCGQTFKAAPALDFGFTTRPLERLAVGGQVQNISFSGIRLGEVRHALPVCFTLGACYRVYSSLYLSASVEKQLQAPLAGKCGLQWNVRGLRLYFGVRILERTSPSIGVGYKTARWGFDLACLYDLKLGVQSSVGVYYCLK